MTHRTKEEWLTLFDAQIQSGLTQGEFCSENGLSQKYFSIKKSKLKRAAPSAKAFIKATASVETPLQGHILKYGAAELQMNPHVDVSYLANLLKRLA